MKTNISRMFVFYIFLSFWGNRWEGDHWGDLGVDGWIILGWNVVDDP